MKPFTLNANEEPGRCSDQLLEISYGEISLDGLPVLVTVRGLETKTFKGNLFDEVFRRYVISWITSTISGPFPQKASPLSEDVQAFYRVAKSIDDALQAEWGRVLHKLRAAMEQGGVQ